MSIPNREDLAWAAGLFEGEGCFCCNKKQRGAPHAILGMTDEDVVRRFHSIFGIGNVLPRKPSKAGWKQQWVWQVGSFEHFQAVVAMLWPWLCSRRREKAKLILKTHHDLTPASFRIKIDRFVNVRAELAVGNRTQRDIARMYGITPSAVTMIKQRGTGYIAKTQLTSQQHAEIRRLHKSGEARSALARTFTCSVAQIRLIVLGRSGVA